MKTSYLHPLYSTFLSDWELMADCYRGERVVKEQGFKYLPATPGQIIDGIQQATQKGYQNYLAYKLRARFPDFVSQAVEAMLGIMHRKPAVIELPTKMQPLIEKATVRGESLAMLLIKMNKNQLISGRMGLLADVPDGAPAGTLPYIALYGAPTILNWDDEGKEALKLVVLDETEFERQGFEWTRVEKFRIMKLDDAGKFVTGIFKDDYAEEDLIQPSMAGRTLEEVPFVIVNATDIVPDPDDPPLLGLGQLAMAVYRGEADYRQCLFMQGQETLVIIGGDAESSPRVGAGAHLTVPIGGDAKYIGVSASGLNEMRSSIENDRQEAAEIGSRLMSTRGGNAESGDALRTRVAARTASLTSIANASAAGLQRILRVIARWMGADESKVIVTPNLDFADDELDGATVVQFMTAKGLGAPISKRTIHDLMRKHEITELTFEEEMEEIAEEAPELDGTGDDTVNSEGQDVDRTDDVDTEDMDTDDQDQGE